MDRKRKLELFDTDGKEQGDGGNAQIASGDAAINPYTGRPYTPRYFEILSGRAGKHVEINPFTYMSQFQSRADLFDSVSSFCPPSSDRTYRVARLAGQG